MKGCLLVLALAVAGAAAMIAVVMVVGHNSQAEYETVTKPAAAMEHERRHDPRGTPPNRKDGYRVEYRYESGGQWFASSAWVAARNVSKLDVCVDPEDPARHTVRYQATTPCGQGHPLTSGVHRAKAIASPNAQNLKGK